MTKRMPAWKAISPGLSACPGPTGTGSQIAAIRASTRRPASVLNTAQKSRFSSSNVYGPSGRALAAGSAS